MSDESAGTIQRLPQETLGNILKYVVLRGSPEDAAVGGVMLAFKLSEVNRYFHSVVISTPSLWSNVSNKQPMPVFNRCMERSKEHPLCVAIFLRKELEDWFSDFASAVISQAARWREFYFDSNQDNHYFHLHYSNLLVFDQELQLPQLRRLSLIYPSEAYSISVDLSPDLLEEMRRYDPNDTIYHLYKKWTTPNLHFVTTKNVVPYHTHGSRIRSCSVQFRGYTRIKPAYRPMLSMFPHWQNLRNLELDIADFVTNDMDNRPQMAVTTLPSLETITATFNVSSIRNFNYPMLNLLDFPNITKIKIYVIYDLIDDDYEEAHDFRIASVQSRACCPLRDGSHYPNLTNLKILYWMPEYGQLTIIFNKRSAASDVGPVYYLESRTERGPRGVSYADTEQYLGISLRVLETSGELSLACIEKLYPIIGSQPGWQGLTRTGSLTDCNDGSEFIHDRFYSMPRSIM